MRKSGIIIALTELTKDNRIFKTAAYLSDHGIDITSLSCHSYDIQPRKDDINGIHLIRLSPLGDLFLRIIGTKQHSGSASCSASPGKGWYHELFGLVNFCYFILVQLRLFLYLLPSRYDYCHTNDWDTLLAGYLYSRFRKSVWIHDSHEIYAEQDPDFPRSFRRLVTITESFLFQRVDALITVNDSIADYFGAQYHIRRPSVIYNCPVFEEINPPDDVRKPVKIIYVGSLEKHRGLEELIEIAPALDGELYFQGFGSMEGYLRDKIADSGMGDKIFFIDHVPVSQIVTSLSRFDVGIIPYKPVCLNNYYSSPNKLFEYMMAGLAIISVDIPVVRGLVDRCQNGLLYDPDNIEDLIEKVRTLVNSPGLVRTMKKNSIFHARDYYYWDRQAEKLLDMYR